MGEEDLDLFKMANLYPRNTGLPMTVWVSPRGRAQHAARIKVSKPHGDRMDLSNFAVVGINPAPALIEGSLSTPDLRAVTRWIDRNRDALNDLWDGKIDGIELAARLVKV
jgi:3-methyladenine DNA glycosylase AlkD